MLEEEKSGAGSEIREAKEFTQELKLADKLALERTVMAADRTMLAGVRTSMSFIGFGFTIFNILKYVQEHSSDESCYAPSDAKEYRGVHAGRGNRPLFFMIIQYSRTLKRMGKIESAFSNPNFQMAVAILMLGIILLVTLIGNILLL